MATVEYDEVLELAKRLSQEDRARLVHALADSSREEPPRKHSILELEGLGADVWQGIDAQQYVREERDSWDR